MYENYCKIRDGLELKDSDVAKGTGITKSTFSDWKSGRSTPKGEKLQKIADFLHVSVDYLMTGKEPESNQYYLNDETAAMAQEIFENRDLRLLFDAARDADPESLKALHTMALALKRKEGGMDDDAGC